MYVCIARKKILKKSIIILGKYEDENVVIHHHNHVGRCWIEKN